MSRVNEPHTYGHSFAAPWYSRMNVVRRIASYRSIWQSLRSYELGWAHAAYRLARTILTGDSGTFTVPERKDNCTRAEGHDWGVVGEDESGWSCWECTVCGKGRWHMALGDLATGEAAVVLLPGSEAT